MGRETERRRIAKQAADWALRLADGDLSAKDRQTLSDWSKMPEHAAALHRAAGILGDSSLILRADASFTKDNFDPQESSGAAAKIAGTLAILAALCLGYGIGLPLRLQAEFVTAANQVEIITLADGSRVRLNGDSALAEDFDASIRRVRLLKGQAYFDVAKDASRPFVVEADGGEVRALGTAFDVNLVGSHSEVTVIESSVLVSAGVGNGRALLQPGDRIIYDRDGKLGAIRKVPAGLEAPWLSGHLVFEERPLSSVVEEIFRQLPGSFMIANPATGRRLVSGSFDLKDPEAAFRSFSEAMKLRVVRAGPFLTLIY